MRIIQTNIKYVTLDDLRPLKDYDSPVEGTIETNGYVVVSIINSEYDRLLLATGSIEHYTPSENEKILHIVQYADLINIIRGEHIKVINVEEVE
jgi:hypothetical protein